ncbi:hypothetical protein B0T17DRAFT_222151 [Bombardia bombarda]|uniref:chitinase n=1 Tax=Bombardia bombarda TaxID=252184 RepID=A0AA40CAQ2_9PEZI|nr:hypothetical protein B0T17DRAFT_222151 [Bombardia bombarda]
MWISPPLELLVIDYGSSSTRSCSFVSFSSLSVLVTAVGGFVQSPVAVMLFLKTAMLAVSALVVLVTAQDYSCGVGKPCALGCCGKTGVCGMGPTFCGTGNCTSECTAKADCNPGWDSKYSTQDKCPLNVCCSKFGFCGTTAEFCGTNTVKKPSSSGTNSNGRTIGYYEAWSTTRACDGMYPENIPAGAYTHLNYAFAFVDPVSFAIAPMSDLDKELWPRFTALKETNPGLQTWISVGGWSMNDPEQPTAKTFSNLAASTAAQQKFFKSLISFMQTYGFDGADIDWEYPVAVERSGIPADYANYVTFLKNMKAAFASSGHKYGLSITVPSSYWYLRNFDIVGIAKTVDFISIMTYDLHGTWDSTIASLGPKVMAHTNLTEIDQTMDLFWRNDIDPKKLNLGLGFYGRSFTLTDPTCKKAGCGFSGGGRPGSCTDSAGTLSFTEIQRLVDAGATMTLDKAAAVQIVTYDKDQWVSFDNAETFKMKLDYANKLGLGGTLVWAASTDDSVGTAAAALSATTGRMALSLKMTTRAVDPITTCVWGECKPKGKTTCPQDGLSAAQFASGKGKGNVGFYNACPEGQERAYCCPKNDVPTCQWRGHGINCSKEKCTDDEVEVTTNVGGCWFGHTRLCCKKTTSDAAIGQCKWEGASPFCSAVIDKQYGCDESDRSSLTYSNYGAGGEEPCVLGYKSLCCVKPAPFSNCEWVRSSGLWSKIAHPLTCDGSCPSGKTPIANDPSGCFGTGSQFFCCENPSKTPDIPVKNDFCFSTEGDFVEATEKDEDAIDSHDILELWWYEDECFAIPNTADPSVHKRAVDISSSYDLSGLEPNEILTLWTDSGMSYQFPITDEFAREIFDKSLAAGFRDSLGGGYENVGVTTNGTSIEERTGSRISKICNANNVQINSFSTSTYPGSQSLIKNSGRLVFASVTTGGCLALNLGKVAHGALAAGVKVVVEHVTELQTPKNFMNAILKAKLPGGAAASKLRYDAVAVFTKGGYFDKTLTQLGIANTFPNANPNEALSKQFFTIFGNAVDVDNLQILTAKANSLKAAVWGIFVNINADSKWAKMSETTRVAVISELKLVVDYMNQADVQTSFKLTYDKWRSIFAALDSSGAIPVVNAGGIGLEAALKEYYAAFFPEMQKNLQAYVLRRLPDMITYWQSPAGIALKGATEAAAIVVKLNNLKNNAGTTLKIGSSFI